MNGTRLLFTDAFDVRNLNTFMHWLSQWLTLPDEAPVLQLLGVGDTHGSHKVKLNLPGGNVPTKRHAFPAEADLGAVMTMAYARSQCERQVIDAPFVAELELHVAGSCTLFDITGWATAAPPVMTAHVIFSSDTGNRHLDLLEPVRTLLSNLEPT